MGSISSRAKYSATMRYLRLRHGNLDDDRQLATSIQEAFVATLHDASDVLDGAVTFAFDAVYSDAGELDTQRTHYLVENDFVAGFAATHERVLFGASINPYRRDAIAALERAVSHGAVLLKWLPVTQDIDPANPRVFEFYDALAHYALPLLTHTGVEHTLPVLSERLADPMLLEPALRRGVTVILAHAGLHLWPWESSRLPAVRHLMQRYEHCYADTAALAIPTRMRALRRLFADPLVGPRLLHGSDWPISSFPHPLVLGPATTVRTALERNLLRRDVRLKEALGAPPEYWTRAARVLRLPESKQAHR